MENLWIPLRIWEGQTSLSRKMCPIERLDRMCIFIHWFSIPASPALRVRIQSQLSQMSAGLHLTVCHKATIRIKVQSFLFALRACFWTVGGAREPGALGQTQGEHANPAGKSFKPGFQSATVNCNTRLQDVLLFFNWRTDGKIHYTLKMKCKKKSHTEQLSC